MLEISETKEMLSHIEAVKNSIEEKSLLYFEKEFNSLLKDMENLVNVLKLYKTTK